jgi:transcriptional regulator with XRE-family HTH domain
MKLGDWLKREKMTLEDFGLRIGRSHSAVSRYVSGERVPGRETMGLILTQTGGEVTPNDFYRGGVESPLTDDNGAGEADPSAASAPHAA